VTRRHRGTRRHFFPPTPCLGARVENYSAGDRGKTALAQHRRKLGRATSTAKRLGINYYIPPTPRRSIRARCAAQRLLDM